MSADFAKLLREWKAARLIREQLPDDVPEAENAASYEAYCAVENGILATPIRSAGDAAVKLRIVALRADVRVLPAIAAELDALDRGGRP